MIMNGTCMDVKRLGQMHRLKLDMNIVKLCIKFLDAIIPTIQTHLCLGIATI